MIRSDGIYSPPKKSDKLSFSVERLISTATAKKDEKTNVNVISVECTSSSPDDNHRNTSIKSLDYPLVPVPLLAARNSSALQNSLLSFPMVSTSLGLSPTGNSSIVGDSSPTAPISFTHFSWLPGDGDPSGTSKKCVQTLNLVGSLAHCTHMFFIHSRRS